MNPPLLPMAQFCRFTEVTAEAGLNDSNTSTAHLAKSGFRSRWRRRRFIDYDGDEWLDILLVGGGALAPNTIRSRRRYVFIAIMATPHFH
jgi:hypothetical protein